MNAKTTDHRRAVADRNSAAILDATERLLVAGKPLNMASVATEAGVSRPTLYSHHATISSIVEAAVSRAVEQSVETFEAAQLEEGDAVEALRRLLAAAWTQLAGFDALARGATEHVSRQYLHKAHAPVFEHIGGLIARGQSAGEFRDDMSVEWLFRGYVALVHAADEYAHSSGLAREEVLQTLTASVLVLFTAGRLTA